MDSPMEEVTCEDTVQQHAAPPLLTGKEPSREGAHAGSSSGPLCTVPAGDAPSSLQLPLCGIFLIPKRAEEVQHCTPLAKTKDGGNIVYVASSSFAAFLVVARGKGVEVRPLPVHLEWCRNVFSRKLCDVSVAHVCDNASASSSACQHFVVPCAADEDAAAMELRIRTATATATTTAPSDEELVFVRKSGNIAFVTATGQLAQTVLAMPGARRGGWSRSATVAVRCRLPALLPDSALEQHLRRLDVSPLRIIRHRTVLDNLASFAVLVFADDESAASATQKLAHWHAKASAAAKATAHAQATTKESAGTACRYCSAAAAQADSTNCAKSQHICDQGCH